jgi:hypothetical protein
VVGESSKDEPKRGAILVIFANAIAAVGWHCEPILNSGGSFARLMDFPDKSNFKSETVLHGDSTIAGLVQGWAMVGVLLGLIRHAQFWDSQVWLQSLQVISPEDLCKP